MSIFKRPRKDKTDSDAIAPVTLKTINKSAKGATLGSTWEKSIFILDPPVILAESTNGFTFTSSYNDYWTPWMSKDDTTNEATVEYNFGNPTFTVSSSEADDEGYGSFEYDVPTGYYSICSKNIAEYG